MSRWAGSVARGVEGSLDVVDLPDTVRVHLTRDDIEACAGEGVAPLAQPGLGSRNESCPFALVHGLERAPEGVPAPSLYLDERYEPPPADHEVDLDTTRTDVALEDAVAARFEVRGGTILTLVT